MDNENDKSTAPVSMRVEKNVSRFRQLHTTRSEQKVKIVLNESQGRMSNFNGYPYKNIRTE
ncbi:hypothetical protein [Listeria valentina]|uniref:hypothetical protein n=1 Tax=Listeria valentina TaxID=2705293 RepID=UPI0014303A92|nr:hypothetical protein [Listeria valentina]